MRVSDGLLHWQQIKVEMEKDEFYQNAGGLKSPFPNTGGFQLNFPKPTGFVMQCFQNRAFFKH